VGRHDNNGLRHVHRARDDFFRRLADPDHDLRGDPQRPGRLLQIDACFIPRISRRIQADDLEEEEFGFHVFGKLLGKRQRLLRQLRSVQGYNHRINRCRTSLLAGR
jgi:hypothetical protein